MGNKNHSRTKLCKILTAWKKKGGEKIHTSRNKSTLYFTSILLRLTVPMSIGVVTESKRGLAFDLELGNEAFHYTER